MHNDNDNDNDNGGGNSGNRILALEVKEQATFRDLQSLNQELDRMRTSHHNLRDDTHAALNVIRCDHDDLRQIVHQNSTQISVVIERYKRIEKVVSNNTEVMSQLRGGIKLAVWVVGSVGGLTGMFIIASQFLKITNAMAL